MNAKPDTKPRPRARQTLCCGKCAKADAGTCANLQKTLAALTPKPREVRRGV